MNLLKETESKLGESIEDLLNTDIKTMEGKGLLQDIKDLENGNNLQENTEKVSSRPRAKDLLENFRENTGSIRSNEMKPELVRDLKQKDKDSTQKVRKMKDADKKFLEMVDEAEQMIEETLKVGDRNLEEEF